MKLRVRSIDIMRFQTITLSSLTWANNTSRSAVGSTNSNGVTAVQYWALCSCTTHSIQKCWSCT